MFIIYPGVKFVKGFVKYIKNCGALPRWLLVGMITVFDINRTFCHNILEVIWMNRLKALRKERGYTQVKMQMLTGTDQSDYSKIEQGKRYYTFEQCRRIALALNTSMDYLAGLTDERKPYPRKLGE